MGKTMLHALLQMGGVSRKLRRKLESEEIILSDVGDGGWYKTENFSFPGRRYLRRTEDFSGCLAITKRRITCYTFWDRLINISVNDPKISALYVDLLDPETLSISCQSSFFRSDRKGITEFHFRTEKAKTFYDILRFFGFQEGVAAVPSRT